MADSFQRQQGLVTTPALRSGNPLSESLKILDSAQFNGFRRFVDGFRNLVEQYQGSSQEALYHQLISPLADCFIQTYQSIHPQKNTYENTDYNLIFELLDYTIQTITLALPPSGEESLLEDLKDNHVEKAFSGIARLKECEATLDQLVLPLLQEIPQWKKNGDVLVLDIDSTALNSEQGHNLPPLRFFEYLLRFTRQVQSYPFAQPLMAAFLEEHGSVNARPQILALYQACEKAEVPVKFLTSRMPRGRMFDTETGRDFCLRTEAELEAAGFNVARPDIYYLSSRRGKAQELAVLVQKGVLPNDLRQIKWFDDSKRIQSELQKFSSSYVGNSASIPVEYEVFSEYLPYFHLVPTKPWLGGVNGLF